MTTNSQVPWTDEQWARANQVIQEEAGRARVAATFLPLYGPLPPDTDFVRADTLSYGDRIDPRMKIDDKSTIQLATLQVKVFLRGAQMADPDMTSALHMFRRAANILARLEDGIVFRGQVGESKGPPANVIRFGARSSEPNAERNFVEVCGGQRSRGLLARAEFEGTIDTVGSLLTVNKMHSGTLIPESVLLETPDDNDDVYSQHVQTKIEKQLTVLLGDDRQPEGEGIYSLKKEPTGGADQGLPDNAYIFPASGHGWQCAIYNPVSVNFGQYPPPYGPLGEILVHKVSKGISRLESQGHFGPFALVMDPRFYEAVQTPVQDTLVLPQDRIIPFLGGGSLLRSSTLPDYSGVLVALGGAPVELVVAKDVSLQFLQVNEGPMYVFRVYEKMALRIKEKEAIVALVLNTLHPPVAAEREAKAAEQAAEEAAAKRAKAALQAKAAEQAKAVVEAKAAAKAKPKPKK